MAEAYNNLGLLWLGAGKFAEAKGEFLQAINRNPRYAAAHYNLGLALLKIGDSAGAQAEFDAAKRLNPEIRQ